MKWDESKHPRDKDGRFSDNDTQSVREELIVELKDEPPTIVEPSDALHRDSYSAYPTVKLPSEEYYMVMHELATNLAKEEQKTKNTHEKHTQLYLCSRK